MDVIAPAGMLDGPQQIFFNEGILFAVVAPAEAGIAFSRKPRREWAAQADADVIASGSDEELDEASVHRCLRCRGRKPRADRDIAVHIPSGGRFEPEARARSAVARCNSLRRAEFAK